MTRHDKSVAAVRPRASGPLGILAVLVVLGANLALAPLGAILVLLWARWSRTPRSELGFVRPRSVARDLAAGVVPIRLTSADATAGLGFTLQPMTSQIAPVAADALTKWAQAKSVAIIYDQTALYTQSVASQLKTLLEQAGVTITAYQPIDPGAKSYADVVKTVAAGNPDVIYAATYYPEGGLIAKAMYQPIGGRSASATRSTVSVIFAKSLSPFGGSYQFS